MEKKVIKVSDTFKPLFKLFSVHSTLFKLNYLVLVGGFSAAVVVLNDSGINLFLSIIGFIVGSYSILSIIMMNDYKKGDEE